MVRMPFSHARRDLTSPDWELLAVNERDAIKLESNEGPNTRSPTNTKSRLLNTGWRFTVVGGAISSTVVLAINLGSTIWAVRHYKVENGVGTLQQGDCDVVRRQSMAFHLVINVLSTVLLAASNFCMVRHNDEL